MTPYKQDIFRELEILLANAEPEEIKALLSDIAHGKFAETAQTRAGSNDNRENVTDILAGKSPDPACDGDDDLTPKRQTS